MCCSPLHAVGFSAVTCVTGVVTLAVGVNSLAAVLALSNLLLYCAVYTPMKRLSPSNTSLGAVVGAIPPLIGWSSATATLDVGQYWSAAWSVVVQSLFYSGGLFMHR